MAEKPILGLRTGEHISAVRDRVDLKTILTTPKERRLTTIDQISRDISSAIGAEIPVEYAITSGMSELSWIQLYHPSALSAVYLGFAGNPTDSNGLEEADATIALHADAIEQRPILENGFLIQPRKVEMSTVVLDSTGKPRIVNQSFSPRTLEAYTSLVSFSEGEIFTQPLGHSITLEDRTPRGILVDNIRQARAIGFGYQGILLVTEKMFQATGDTILADMRYTPYLYPSRSVSGVQYATEVPSEGGGKVRRSWSIHIPSSLELAA